MHAGMLDDALGRFAARGPEFGPGLSNHGPMAAEALVALGRGEEVERWAGWYISRLGDAPQVRNPIGADNWRGALGDIARVADWSAFFRRKVAEHPWREVVATWTPRLVPGIMAGATHGVLRTAHAVRSLERGETPRRVEELADGLGYFAARYQALPTAPGRGGALSPSEAIAHVQRMADDAPRRGLIFKVVAQVPAERFADAINLVDPDVDPAMFIGDLTRTFVRQYLANADAAAIAFIHTVTAPASLRTLAPYLSPDDARDALRYAWQACAAVYAAYARAPQRPLVSDGAEGGAFDRADLVEQAVAARDEHAIKFTEACLREYDASGDGAFIDAARDAVRRLRATG